MEVYKPLKKAPKKPTKDNDLFESIKQFLEDRGIEIYKMNVGQEAYQASDENQIIRIYIKRKRDK